MIRTLLSRVASLLRRQKLDAELDEELRAHIDLATEENMRGGMSRQSACTAALRSEGLRSTYLHRCLAHTDERGLSSLLYSGAPSYAHRPHASTENRVGAR
jgi:hypothetical protein